MLHQYILLMSVFCWVWYIYIDLFAYPSLSHFTPIYLADCTDVSIVFGLVHRSLCVSQLNVTPIYLGDGTEVSVCLILLLFLRSTSSSLVAHSTSNLKGTEGHRFDS